MTVVNIRGGNMFLEKVNFVPDKQFCVEQLSSLDPAQLFDQTTVFKDKEERQYIFWLKTAQDGRKIDNFKEFTLGVLDEQLKHPRRLDACECQVEGGVNRLPAMHELVVQAAARKRSHSALHLHHRLRYGRGVAHGGGRACRIGKVKQRGEHEGEGKREP